MAINQYFFDGVLKVNEDYMTPGFAQAIVMGLLRYMGNSRESENGMERPLMVLLSCDSNESLGVLSYFEDAFETAGVEHANAKILPSEAVKHAFFDLGFDNAIHVSWAKDGVELEIFERGDEIGGIEASLPGGVNYKGEKIQKIPFGIPIPQIAVDQIEHSLNTETGFDTKPAQYKQDLHDQAMEIYEKYKRC